MSANILLYIIIFIYGITIGSFLNVCIYRLPRKEDITRSRSHCRSCGYNLKWYDLVPVMSYLLIKGKCRNCGKKISIQYPIVELLNGILYLLIFFVRGLPSDNGYITSYDLVTVLYCIAASALIVLSIIDFRIYEIPIEINAFLLIIGCLNMGLDFKHWSSYIMGFFTVSLFLYIIYLLSKGRAIGGGDIKQMAVGGLLLGWQGILIAFILGCIVGSVIHLIRMKLRHAEGVLALGPYLSIGMLTAMLYEDQIWSWYLGWY